MFKKILAKINSGWELTSDGVIFRMGGFSSGIQSRSQYSARLYYESTQLRRNISAHTDKPKLGIELGCGYGRLTPHIDKEITDVVGFDINEDALNKARQFYPEIKFQKNTADQIPLKTNKANVVVTWTVLQHIPDDSLKDLVEEIERVISADAVLIFCEKTQGTSEGATIVRSIQDYDNIFSEFRLYHTESRKTEPGCDHQGTVMIFKT